MNAFSTAHHFTPATGSAAPEKTRTLPRALRPFSAAWNAYWDRRARNATLRQLQALDDRMLKDLGMTRDSLRADW